MTDVRYYESVVKRGSVYAISKYAYTSMRMSFSDGSLTFYTTPSVRSSGYCNWIVYRYTEALLFEAEAYIMKAKKIVLLASGASKRAVVQELLNDHITTSVPATLLKVHPDVVLICDKEAYGK